MTGDSETGKRWFYVHDGRRKGPVAAAQLVEMILGDQLSEETLVWHSGLDQWVEAHSVEEIQHELPPPVPGTAGDSGDHSDARVDAEAMGEEAAEGDDAAENGQGAENVEGTNGGRTPKAGAHRRRRHRNRYRLTPGARRSWLVPLIIMVIVVIVVVWYMLRRVNEVPPGQIVPTSALAAAALPAA